MLRICLAVVLLAAPIATADDTTTRRTCVGVPDVGLNVLCALEDETIDGYYECGTSEEGMTEYCTCDDGGCECWGTATYYAHERHTVVVTQAGPVFVVVYGQYDCMSGQESRTVAGQAQGNSFALHEQHWEDRERCWGHVVGVFFECPVFITQPDPGWGHILS